MTGHTKFRDLNHKASPQAIALEGDRIMTIMTYKQKMAAWTKRRAAALAAWTKAHPKPARALPVPLPRLLQHPSPNRSLRGAAVDLVVLHDTEGPYASAVSWLSNPAARASAHAVLREDGKEATQLVLWSLKAWSCVAFNARSLNLEMAGKASVGYGADQIDAAARIVAYWCHLHKIPVRHAVGGAGSGITFHQELGAAGGGHSDPGWTPAQRAAFIAKVKAYSGRPFLPSRWGRA